jgi:hypothetical protein
MRGVTLDLGESEEEKKLWCPLSYEFLLDFCYTCGLIGHTNRMCETQLKKGEPQQYTRALRFILERRRPRESSGSRLGSQNS